MMAPNVLTMCVGSGKFVHLYPAGGVTVTAYGRGTVATVELTEAEWLQMEQGRLELMRLVHPE